MSRPRRAPRHTDETDVTRAPLDQRRHVGLPGADEEIALPMPRDRAVLNRRGALANRDGPDDVAARLRRRWVGECGLCREEISARVFTTS